MTAWPKEDIVPRTTTLQIQGKAYEISHDDIRRVARTHNPERLVGYYVEVDGKKFPPKQLIRLVTGAPADAALNRLVCVTIQLVINPP